MISVQSPWSLSPTFFCCSFLLPPRQVTFPAPRLRTLPRRALTGCLAANCESSREGWGRWDPDSEVLWDNEDAVGRGGENAQICLYMCVHTCGHVCLGCLIEVHVQERRVFVCVVICVCMTVCVCVGSRGGALGWEAAVAVWTLP